MLLKLQFKKKKQFYSNICCINKNIESIENLIKNAKSIQNTPTNDFIAAIISTQHWEKLNIFFHNKKSMQWAFVTLTVSIKTAKNKTKIKKWPEKKNGKIKMLNFFG